MNTTYITCHHCGRRSFLEDPTVVRCPYCDSEQIDTKIKTNNADTALAVMGFDKLNEEQKAIVLSTEGVNYVEAGPGTAKTTTLVARSRYLIHYRYDGTQMPLILTFTNQAVDRLVRSFLNEKPQMRPRVATLHRFAYRMLDEYRAWLPDGFDHFRVMGEDDWNTFFAKNGTDDTAVDGKDSSAIRQEIQLKKLSSSNISNLLTGTASDDPVLASVLAYQRENLLLDFDDLIHVLVWLMKNEPVVHGSVTETCHYVLVDESQDLTDPELEMLDMITARYRNLFLVGDTDQSIYGWRGAKNHVNDWLETLGCKVHRFVLSNNYRSSQAILNVAGNVIESTPNRTHKQLTAIFPLGVKVMVKECPDPFHEARIIASSIELATDPLSQPLPLKYWEIAVLARNHALLRLIRSALIKKKIPVCVDNETPLLQTKVIQAVIRYLRFFADPNLWTMSVLDEQVVPEYLWTRFVREFNASGKSVTEALNDWYERRRPMAPWGSVVLKMLNDLTSPLCIYEKKTLSRTLKELLTLIMTPENEREIREIRELSKKLLKRADGDLKLFLDLLALSAREEMEYCEQKNHVHLLTLHGSKGRQFKKVFIAGTVASIIPNSKSDFEEERRLFYVGVTRARQELVISYYRNSFGYQEEPSPFLADVLQSPSAIFCPVEEYRKKHKPKTRSPN